MEPVVLSTLTGFRRSATLPPKACRSLASEQDPDTVSSDDLVPLIDSKSGPSTTSVSRRLEQPQRSGRFQGWKFGVACSAVSTLVILILNIGVAVTLAHFPTVDGIGTIFEGSCKKSDSWSAGLHVVINVLSSLLLSASNYTMQCLSSPTRRDVDKAHVEGRWLDIGVIGIRNLFGKVPRHRTFFWLALAVSSIPVHLLYNSVIFKLSDIYTYEVFAADQRFLESANLSTSVVQWQNGSIKGTYNTTRSGLSQEDLLETQKWFSNAALSNNTSLVQNLTTTECISNYGTLVLSGRTDVLVIVDTESSRDDNAFVYYQAPQDSRSGSTGTYNWICSNTSYDMSTNVFESGYCNTDTVRQNMTADVPWRVNNHKVNYCLSRLVAPHCRLQFSLHIMIAVIVCNMIKCSAMLWTCLRQKETTLVTVGDAVASFLEEPDRMTKGRCWTDKQDVLNSRPQARTGLYTLPPRKIENHQRLLVAASIRRWTATVGIGGLAFITSLIIFGMGLASAKELGEPSPLSTSFGAYDASTVIMKGMPGLAGLLSAVLRANTPQAILSLIYIAYNGLFTSMLQAAEWNGYYLRKKPLRVSTPRGQQKSTYYLQLPYGYSLPLLGFSMLLHWLVSQSLFLTRLARYRSDGNPIDASGQETSTVSYACLPILLKGLCGIPLLFFVILTARRDVHPQMPLVGSCSIAISAACHRPAEDVDAPYLPVSWGEVVKDGTKDVGHCAFTSYDVEEVSTERLYAGKANPYAMD